MEPSQVHCVQKRATFLGEEELNQQASGLKSSARTTAPQRTHSCFYTGFMIGMGPKRAMTGKAESPPYLEIIVMNAYFHKFPIRKICEFHWNYFVCYFNNWSLWINKRYLLKLELSLGKNMYKGRSI